MIPQKYYDFQDDIKNGMTIQKALLKHDITLEEAFTTLQYQNHNTCKKEQNTYTWTGQKYITRTRWGYLVQKKVRNKTRYCGTYDTLEEAIQVRDYLMENGWTRTNLAQIRKQMEE